MKICNRFHAAFTLLELLVVITLISLLLALLMPAFARIKETSRRLQCMNNLYEIGRAEYAYAADYDGAFYSNGERPLFSGYNNQGWPTAMVPGGMWIGLSNYLENVHLLYCPSALMRGNIRAPQSDLGDNRLPTDWSDVANVQNHYGYAYHLTMTSNKNGVLAFETPGYFYHSGVYYYLDPTQPQNLPPSTLPVPYASIQLQTQMITWSMSGNTIIPTLISTSYSGTTPTATNHTGPNPDSNGGSNVLYADGHVAWFQFTDEYGYGRIGPFYLNPLPDTQYTGPFWPSGSTGFCIGW